MYSLIKSGYIIPVSTARAITAPAPIPASSDFARYDRTPGIAAETPANAAAINILSASVAKTVAHNGSPEAAMTTLNGILSEKSIRPNDIKNTDEKAIIKIEIRAIKMHLAVITFFLPESITDGWGTADFLSTANNNDEIKAMDSTVIRYSALHE